jgi:hypothetical protein
MKFLSSWGTTEYLRLLAILICATAIVAGFLRRRKKLHGQDLLRWLLLTGAVMGLLTWEIFRDNDWLGPLLYITAILLSSAIYFLRKPREEIQPHRPWIEQPPDPANKSESKPRRYSWFLPSLDAKDRKLLLWCLGIGLSLAILTGFLLPNGNDNDNPLPSSYLSGQHGARAAYETLLRSGYQVERWERPLNELAATAGPDTVVIFAQPFTRDGNDIKAVRHILERGGRVLSTGYFGGFILPGEASDTPKEFNFAACKLEPEGLDLLADTGEVWMRPEATWQVGNPAHRVEYSCGGAPAVVEFDWGKGHAVWWASSTPLENGSLARARDLDLLLNSLGPRDGHHFYWDESLHGEIRSNWSYAAGPSLTILRLGLLGLGILIVLSFSRRSGPVRDLPGPARATPIEFLEALGSLYRKAGAGSTAVSVAWERFRRQSLRLCGQRGSQIGAAELAAVIRRRFPQASESLEADLAACEDAAWGETVSAEAALKMIQAMHGHQMDIAAAQKTGSQAQKSEDIHSKQQERAL